jgi:hypothetical protein
MWKWLKDNWLLIKFIWNHKQAITGGITTAASGAAGAGIITAALAVKITFVSGLLTMLFGAVYSLFQRKIEGDPPAVEPAGEPTQP